MGLIQAFPKEWRCDVTVKRSGGKDANGDPTPTQDIPLEDVLVGPVDSSNPVDRSEFPDTSAVLCGGPGIDIRSTDRVIVPVGHLMNGTYQVEGDPGFWPLGTQVNLKRVSS